MIEVPKWICYTIGIIFCVVVGLFTWCSLVISSREDNYINDHIENKGADNED